MITHIRMKNFKSWKDSGEVQLAPLTGFFGTNSSGKSSLLQMLLLLKQTAEHADSEEIIFFGDTDSCVNLGSFTEVIHGHIEDELLELELGCKLKEHFKIETYEKSGDRRHGHTQVLIDNFTFETSIREINGDLNVEHLRYSVESCNFTGISWEKGYLIYKDLLNVRQKVDRKLSKCYGKSSTTDQIFTPFATAFENLFYQIHPLGPTRVAPQRVYHWEGTQPDYIEQNGEGIIDSILYARVDQRTTPYDGRNVPIEDRISAWLREMDLAYSFSIKRAAALTDRDYDVLIQKCPHSAKVSLTDMGFGLSQFIPVLVHCYYAPEGSTLILEQPGIHLHPMVQAQLADLLIEVVNERKLQILVESHSEHLLTRLQRRLVEKQIGQDDVALYFCRNNDGASTIEQLKVDPESGDIKNWPENFFGDVMGDMIAMTDKQIEMIAEKKSEG